MIVRDKFVREAQKVQRKIGPARSTMRSNLSACGELFLGVFKCSQISKPVFFVQTREKWTHVFKEFWKISSNNERLQVSKDIFLKLDNYVPLDKYVERDIFGTYGQICPYVPSSRNSKIRSSNQVLFSKTLHMYNISPYRHKHDIHESLFSETCVWTVWLRLYREWDVDVSRLNLYIESIIPLAQKVVTKILKAWIQRAIISPIRQ